MKDAVGARSKTARQAATAECEALILRIWERRTSWPKGWPPPAAAKALERLSSPDDDPDAPPFYRHQVEDDGERSWLGTLPLLAELHRQEMEVWREAGLAELDLDELGAWLEQAGEELSAEERLALQRLTDAGTSARSRLRRLDPRLAPEEQRVEEDPVARLRDLGIRRDRLIKRAAMSKQKSRAKRPKSAESRPSTKA